MIFRGVDGVLAIYQNQKYQLKAEMPLVTLLLLRRGSPTIKPKLVSKN
jgi:hypothetical protein